MHGNGRMNTERNPRKAGRKPTHPNFKKAPITFKIPQWIIEKLRESPQKQSALIEEALKMTYGWKPPEID